jgi:hypothetical protein
MRWAEQAARMAEITNARNILVRKPQREKQHWRPSYMGIN